MQRMLLFEKSADGNLQQVGSLILIDEKQGIAISARQLIPAVGKTFLVSIDGTRTKLRGLKYKDCPVAGVRISVEPFAYYIGFTS